MRLERARNSQDDAQAAQFWAQLLELERRNEEIELRLEQIRA